MESVGGDRDGEWVGIGVYRVGRNRGGECGRESGWRVWVGIGMESVDGNRDGECGWE